jgi:hypothetical protein
MKILQQVKEAIRAPHVFPGGYPIYAVMSDGEMLCPKCAKGNYKSIVFSTKHGLHDGWQAVGVDVLWEDEAYCAHCGDKLESAYGED